MTVPFESFDHQPRTRIVCGANAIDRLGALVGEWGAQRVLLVTDPHIVEAGHAGRGQAALESAGLEVAVFDGVRENPTTEDVDGCLAVARDANVDTIVGLGGGSSLDTAKGCNFILTNGGKMADYKGRGKASKPMLPLVAVPTTAGTGSECQSFALIADADTHMKMPCGDPKAAPRIALLDPTLTVTQPRIVTANTGIDTMTHAIESAVTKTRNELSRLYSRESFALTVANLPRVLAAPDDLEARARMQLAAAYAGLAIEQSMLGAAHSAANPLTAHHNVIHGQAVGLMMPAVIRFNAHDPAIAELYADLAVTARLASHDAPNAVAVDALLESVQHLMTEAQLPRHLDALGVERKTIEVMSQEATTQMTAQFNPRPVTEADFVGLYEAVYAAA